MRERTACGCCRMVNRCCGGRGEHVATHALSATPGSRIPARASNSRQPFRSTIDDGWSGCAAGHHRLAAPAQPADISAAEAFKEQIDAGPGKPSRAHGDADDQRVLEGRPDHIIHCVETTYNTTSSPDLPAPHTDHR